MKRKILILILMCMSITLFGCNNKNKDVINNIKDRVEKMTAYHATGELEIINSEDIYIYDVDVSYKADDLYRVSLKNTNNNHVQILLKNEEGVYVLTPSLNKSYKFQSEWPYNNSQIYLLQNIVNDIASDANASIEENDGYIITSKVNYANNDNLVKQKVYLDKNYNINKVEVLDKDNNVLMKMTFKDINDKKEFSPDYFDVNSSLNVSNIDETTKSVSKIDSITYPMYIPEKTYLATQNKVSKENGERVILTFEGDNPFMVIEENAVASKEPSIISTYGVPQIIGDVIGVVADNSVTWSSNGVDYYITSNNMKESELVSVANSINTLAVGK